MKGRGRGTLCIDIVECRAYWVNEACWTMNYSKSSLIPFLPLFNKSMSSVYWVLAKRHTHRRWYPSEEHHRPEAMYVLGSVFFYIFSLLQIGYAKWYHQVQQGDFQPKERNFSLGTQSWVFWNEHTHYTKKPTPMHQSYAHQGSRIKGCCCFNESQPFKCLRSCCKLSGWRGLLFFI